MISPNYFDYAAATPLDADVLNEMMPYLGDIFFNPSAEYLAGKQVAKSIGDARSLAAQCLGVRSSEIVFTAGGTEANNLAIRGIMQRHPGAEVLLSSIEHDSVLAPAADYKHKQMRVDNQGYVDLESLQSMISDSTVLVSVMYANNEIGTVQPLSEITQIVRKVNKLRKAKGDPTPLYLHTDASQAGNYLSLKVDSLGVDMMTINGGKIYGPKQSGLLFVRAGIVLAPQIRGGGQENSLRSGTENVAGIIGLASAAEKAGRLRPAELVRMRSLRGKLIDRLEEVLPALVVNGGKKQLPNIVHFTIPRIDNEQVMMQLDELGFQVAVGSACSASNDEPSHVLKAMGLTDTQAQSSLRISMGRFTTPQSVDELIVALTSVCH